MKIWILLVFFTTASLYATPKKALIFGITGQDGAYLAEFLLEKGYEVHGVKRRSASHNTFRIDHLYEGPQQQHRHFILHYGDLTDGANILHILQKVAPDEIYNLGAQSHVQVSFEMPEYTAEVNALGTLRILEAIKTLGWEKRTKYYQASTSELFGLSQDPTQSETTSFCPRSPYAIAKLFAHWTAINYREAYGIFACNGVLFNHESPRRGETFVTRKITQAVARISQNLQDTLYLGNLDARRDWGYAKDYVEPMWLILQQDTPQDFVIATGENHSVREFVEIAFKEVGIDLVWKGEGVDEVGINKVTGADIVRIDPRYFRPTEVDSLLGDASKAKNLLDWQPKTSFSELIKLMVAADVENIAQ